MSSTKVDRACLLVNEQTRVQLLEDTKSRSVLRSLRINIIYNILIKLVFKVQLLEEEIFDVNSYRPRKSIFYRKHLFLLLLAGFSPDFFSFFFIFGYFFSFFFLKKEENLFIFFFLRIFYFYLFFLHCIHTKTKLYFSFLTFTSQTRNNISINSGVI